MSTLLAPNRLSLIDADLDAALGAEVMHGGGGGRGTGLGVASGGTLGGGVVGFAGGHGGV